MTKRALHVGGVDKPELLRRLAAAGVQLNEAARSLFSDDRFTTSRAESLIEVVEISVAGIGFAGGATFNQIVERAAQLGHALVPLELAPHFRLAFPDQPEGSVGQPQTRGRAPPGAITVASAPLSDDDETPKGFYLRRIEGILWLRGYRSWPGHLYDPADVFAFRSGIP